MQVFHPTVLLKSLVRSINNRRFQKFKAPVRTDQNRNQKNKRPKRCWYLVALGSLFLAVLVHTRARLIKNKQIFNHMVTLRSVKTSKQLTKCSKGNSCRAVPTNTKIFSTTLIMKTSTKRLRRKRKNPRKNRKLNKHLRFLK